MRSASQQTELFEARQQVLPGGMSYEADFISAEEEAALLAAIGKLELHEAQYKQFTARRRIASFGAQYDFSSNVLQTAPPLPPSLEPLRDRVARHLALTPQRLSHVLVAEYRPGTPLGWHRDVPQFELIAGLSLGGWARMRLRPYPPRADKREGVLVLELEPRSLYVMQGDARWRWQHSIAPTKSLRHSITFRTLGAER
jgi:alkylated DNA repair dioxygenase AlkB